MITLNEFIQQRFASASKSESQAGRCLHIERGYAIPPNTPARPIFDAHIRLERVREGPSAKDQEIIRYKEIRLSNLISPLVIIRRCHIPR
jgi:hypothetical protein